MPEKTTEAPDISKIRRVFYSRLKNAMESDKYIISKELNQILQRNKNTSGKYQIGRKIKTLEKRLNRSIQRKQHRQTSIPSVSYPDFLPITARKEEIIEAIRNHQVIVITGETGSGKTTQIPKMCLDAGRGINGIIGCTQPRRIAAITMCQRLASELGEASGLSVGYKIRFEDRSSNTNYIQFMTDGMLLMETQSNQYLSAYDTLIIDEAHERSINIDFILGILKGLITKRNDLKIIITSATIDPEKFSRFFDNAPIIEVSGRMYPVEIRYRPFENGPETDDTTYVDEAVDAVEELKKEGLDGDVLIFMPTEQDIRETCEILKGRNYRNAKVLPLFARLSSSEQRQIFLPSREQKIIVATNVAETSLTIPGIKYVIDSGVARIAEYNPRTRMTSLPVKYISKSSADQRKGRCGRIQNGICIRLYDEAIYENLPSFTVPEILRSNLAEVILRMTALKIGDIASFPFVDPPNPKNIRDGFAILQELDAIKTVAGKNRFSLTEKGTFMARLPIDPRISRMIIEAKNKNCLAEILIIASALSLQDPRERPMDKEVEADRQHKAFVNPASDFITILNVWNKYHEAFINHKTQNKMRKYCFMHFLSYKRMREWINIHEQLTAILKEEGLLKNSEKINSLQGEALYEGIHKSILSGYLSNIAVRKGKNIYRSSKGKEVMLFPGSGLFNKGKDWIVAAEIVETSNLFARTAAFIQSEWVETIGKKFCSYTYFDPHWEKNRGTVTAKEQVSIYGLIIIPERSIQYGRVNPEEASKIFIKEALVTGNITRPFFFLDHNLSLLQEATDMEDRIRRKNIKVDEEDLASFYEQRLGSVYDIRTLQKLIKDKGGDDFLKMSRKDVLRYHPTETLDLFPQEIRIGNTCLPCSYRFEPGIPEDGVTLNVPSNLASFLPLESADWHIPGLLEEKVTSLIKGLPKEFRKQLIPISKTVSIILQDMPRGSHTLLTTLAQFIYDRFAISIPASAWPLAALPDHLKMRFAVLDDNGKEIQVSRDLDLLKNASSTKTETSAFTEARNKLEKQGITTWDFGDLPDFVTIQSPNNIETVAYPALTDEPQGISIRLFTDKIDATTAHYKGLQALFSLNFSKDIKFLKKSLILPEKIRQWAQYFGGEKHLEDILFQKIMHTFFDHDVRTQDVFFQHIETVRPLIFSSAQKLLQEIEPVLTTYHAVRSELRLLERAYQTNATVITFLNSLRNDLARLVPSDFLSRYDQQRLVQLPRYLNAIIYRARRGVVHLGKDQKKAQMIDRFTNYLNELRTNSPRPLSSEKAAALDQIAWMIEEYKISLFAPEIKTLFSISAKRLEEKRKEIERIV